MEHNPVYNYDEITIYNSLENKNPTVTYLPKILRKLVSMFHARVTWSYNENTGSKKKIYTMMYLHKVHDA